jgi:hypothetical protein
MNAVRQSAWPAIPKSSGGSDDRPGPGASHVMTVKSSASPSSVPPGRRPITHVVMKRDERRSGGSPQRLSIPRRRADRPPARGVRRVDGPRWLPRCDRFAVGLPPGGTLSPSPSPPPWPQPATSSEACSPPPPTGRGPARSHHGNGCTPATTQRHSHWSSRRWPSPPRRRRAIHQPRSPLTRSSVPRDPSALCDRQDRDQRPGQSWCRLASGFR